MTYSSRNFLMSCGTGSDDDRAPPRASNLLSSAMMSLQTSTHSSQMKTVGPAMSLRTSFWSLLQNEQRRISPSPAFLTMNYPSGERGADTWKPPMSGSFADDIVNNTVFLPLLGAHDVVPLGIGLDALEGLPRMAGQHLVQPFTG